MSAPLSLTEAKELIRLCETGRLYEVEAWWTGNAADLATTNLIAVHPVTGWWRERPHLGRYEKLAKYSLIVSIEAPQVEVDLYTPIATQATIVTEVER
jgi:hypothetical protein